MKRILGALETLEKEVVSIKQKIDSLEAAMKSK